MTPTVALLLPLAAIGLVPVCGVAWCAWELIAEWRCERRQRRLEDEQQRGYRMGRERRQP